MTITTTELQEYITHIKSILLERIVWYEKRQLEKKRSLKAFCRAQIIPDVIKTYAIIEAELQYRINLIGVRAIELSQESTPPTIKDFLEKVEYQFEFLLDDNSFQFYKVESQDKSLLFAIVFSLDENQQRINSKKFLKKYYDKFLKAIFQQMSVFESDFIKEVKGNLKNFLDKELL